MSRSFRKNLVYKDSGGKRTLYNRPFRRVNKQRLKQGKRPFERIREYMNDWDICDYYIYIPSWYKTKEEMLESKFYKAIHRKQI